MSNPDANNPYKQPTLPYQSYQGYMNPPRSQQQEFVHPSTTARASASHSSSAAPLRSTQARSAPPHQHTAKSASPRLSKAEALALVDTCKKWLIAGSFVAFGILSTANHKFAPSLTANTRRATLGLGGDANARSQARLSNRTDGRRSRTASPTRPRSQIASSPGRACADHFASV